jgi:hypothetical protein
MAPGCPSTSAILTFYRTEILPAGGQSRAASGKQGPYIRAFQPLAQARMPQSLKTFLRVSSRQSAAEDRLATSRNR